MNVFLRLKIANGVPNQRPDLNFFLEKLRSVTHKFITIWLKKRKPTEPSVQYKA